MEDVRFFFLFCMQNDGFHSSKHATHADGECYPGLTFVARILIIRMHKVRCFYPGGSFVELEQFIFSRNSRQGSTSWSTWSGGS
jgi:hypothetical protein